MRELGFIALMYVAYAASRVFADDSLAPARERAMRILSIEDNLFLDVERDVVSWFVSHDVAGLLAAYYYATAHYLVTAVVLLWLYRRRAELYPRARQVLIGSTLVALVGYLLMPTAPPRLVGYADLMAMHAGSGWWGEAASAPQGMGWMTNQLAAFPSMHAGWALWVALAVMASHDQPLVARGRLGPRPPDRGRRRRHRQPLAARRRRRVGARRARVEGRRATAQHPHQRRVATAPCGRARGRSSSTSAAG